VKLRALAPNGGQDVYGGWFTNPTNWGTTIPVTVDSTTVPASVQQRAVNNYGLNFAEHCVSGSTAAVFGSSAGEPLRATVLYEMPDAGTQYTTGSDDVADGDLTVTLPYDVPQLEALADGAGTVTGAQAAGAPESSTFAVTMGGSVPVAVTAQTHHDDATKTPLARAQVLVQERGAKNLFTTIGTGTTNAAGQVTVSATPRGSGVLRVIAGGTSIPAQLAVKLLPTVPLKAAATAAAQAAELTWQGPASTGSEALTAFSIAYRRTGSTAWTYRTLPASARSARITMLSNKVRYEFRVASLTPAGRSPYTAGVSAAPGVPSPARGVRVSPGAGAATVSWAAPAGTGGYQINGYTVQYRASASSTWRTAARVGGGTRSVRKSALLNGRTYQFRVVATNAVASGGASSAVIVRVGTPTTPRSVKAVPGSRRLTVLWVPPAAPNGSGVSGYLVRYRVVGGTSWRYVAATATARSKAITGLTAGHRHDVQVTARNARGYGPWSMVARGVPGR
jgi:titin